MHHTIFGGPLKLFCIFFTLWLVHVAQPRWHNATISNEKFYDNDASLSLSQMERVPALSVEVVDLVSPLEYMCFVSDTMLVFQCASLKLCVDC